MDALRTNETTRVMGAPRTWDHSVVECSQLPICDVPMHGMNAMVSVWVPTEVELAQLNSGGAVRLTIFGEQHPVVGLDTLPVFAVRTLTGPKRPDFPPEAA